ncbi:HlyD family secretion protein [Rubripirellula obstinata]|uniref:HlyD family secretion protein n=2 Tax=Rubripirellula obstinata TaxID=406547 RepID=A0A5B1CGV2_9BACT|nr:HlyD family secretion protein [Rubripirellula obstinata]
MLRELAAAARDEIPTAKFVSILCDRTLRAMSAEGIVIWESLPKQSSESSSDAFRPIARLGSVTDRDIDDQTNRAADSIPSPAWSAHQSLLATIAGDGEPAVVPSTPDVTEPDVPANPTSVPAALVPIDAPGNISVNTSGNPSGNPSFSRRVIEVFLEPGGGIVAQRGYLRFVCQVADLAGEFFRAEQLRTLLRQQSLAEKCDQLIANIHELDRSEKVATLVVDELAEIFQLDRVAISRISGKPKSQVIAVSHVETIDHYSESAQQIRTVAAVTLDNTGAAWISTDEENAASLAPVFAASGIGSESKQRDHGFRVTGFRLAAKQNNPKQDALQEFEKRELLRTVGQTLRMIQQIDHNRQPSLVRLIRHPSTDRHLALHTAKRVTSFAIIAAAIALVMIVPVPKTIEANATLRARDTQAICAISDAVVETIQVEHGQHVRAGDVLMTLSDSNLDQQITTLVGRRAVLAEQKMRLTEDMVDSSASDFDSFEKIQGQRSVVDEEIASVNQQLMLLRQTKDSLTIRSDRDGVIDAWQITKRLGGRPVSRGDSLLQVVSHDSAWLVDAEVSQARIQRVRQADQANKLSAQITIDDAPGVSSVASDWQFGPTRQINQATSGDAVTTAVTLTLAVNDIAPSPTTVSAQASRIGAPARVYFDCGSVPLGDLLLGDLYRDIRNHLALHWRFSDDDESTSF